MKLMAAAFSLMMVVTIACSSNKGGKGGGTSNNTPPASQCKADDDCVVIETGCCDHCNGGKAVAYPKSAGAPKREEPCTDRACTELACGPALPHCNAGKCEVKIGELK